MSPRFLANPRTGRNLAAAGLTKGREPFAKTRHGTLGERSNGCDAVPARADEPRARSQF
jgi:hypothetical protein